MSHLKVAYTNIYVLKWSVWVAFATCGYFQVGNYIQALWKYIETEDNPENYNGAVEATATLIGIQGPPPQIDVFQTNIFS